MLITAKVKTNNGCYLFFNVCWYLISEHGQDSWLQLNINQAANDALNLAYCSSFFHMELSSLIICIQFIHLKSAEDYRNQC
jgi:hypothetical protein